MRFRAHLRRRSPANSQEDGISTRIAVISCKWHPLAGLGEAAESSSRPNVAVEPVKCSGVVTVAFLLKLFAKGVDGVLVLGCAEGGCDYYGGGERCKAIVEETREILEISGIPAARLGFSQMADSTAGEYEKALKGFIRQFTKARGGRKRVAAQGRR